MNQVTFPLWGEKSSSKHSQDSKHVLSRDSDTNPLSHDKFVIEQENDPERKDLGQRALTLQEAEEVLSFLQTDWCADEEMETTWCSSMW